MKRPPPDRMLSMLAAQLLLEHAPVQQDSYRSSQLQVIAACLMMVSEDGARGVLRILDETAKLRMFFEERLDTDLPAEVRKTLQSAMEPADRPSSVAEATAGLDRLRGALVDYHRWVEETLGPKSEENRQIWTLLAATHRNL